MKNKKIKIDLSYALNMARLHVPGFEASRDHKQAKKLLKKYLSNHLMEDIETLSGVNAEVISYWSLWTDYKKPE